MTKNLWAKMYIFSNSSYHAIIHLLFTLHVAAKVTKINRNASNFFVRNGLVNTLLIYNFHLQYIIGTHEPVMQCTGHQQLQLVDILHLL